MYLKKSQISIFIYYLFLSTIVLGQNEWKNLSPNGGRVRAIAINPHDFSNMFINVSNHGFFSTINSGEKWCFHDNLLEFSYTGGKGTLSNIVITENRILFAEQSLLFKSPDLGQNWEILFGDIFGLINSIAVDKTNSNIIYIGVAFGTGGIFPGNPGVLKTIDGGENWYQVNDGLTNLDITDIKISHQNADKLYVGTYDGIYVTYSGGESGWQKINANLPPTCIHAIAVDSSDTNIIYIGTGMGVFKSVDSGNYWKNITGENFENRFVNLQALTVLGDSAKIVFAGTQNGLYKSMNGGLSWLPKNNGLANRAINTIHPINEYQILLGTSDGFYQSYDGGESWAKNVIGLNAFDVKNIAFGINTNSSSIIIGTGGAGIYRSEDYGNTWIDVNMDSGLAYVDAISCAPSNPEIIFASYICPSKTSDVNTKIKKSIDGGISWNSLSQTEFIDKFILDLEVSPNNPSVIFAGTLNNKVFKSTDGGFTWQQKSNGINMDGIESLAIDPHNPDIVYAGTEFKDGIYKTINGGENWQYSSIGLPIGSSMIISDIVINPLNSNTIYAAIPSMGIYKTWNAGKIWRWITRGLNYVGNDNLIYTVAIDPQDTNRVYAAGTNIYCSDDAGYNWREMADGLPDFYGSINRIRLDPNDPDYIYAASDGYGLFIYHRIHSALNDKKESVQASSLILQQNYPNPFNPITTIQYQLPEETTVSLIIYNMNGQIINKLVNHQVQPAGIYQAQWSATDMAGNAVSSAMYFYKLICNDFVDVKKMLLLR